MGSPLTKSRVATENYTVGSTKSSRSRSYVTENSWNQTGKVSGGFITLPGGYRFRMTTELHKYTARNSPGSPELRTGKSVSGLGYSLTSSPGGYFSDSPLDPATNQGNFQGGTGCLTRLNTSPDIATLMGNEAKTKALISISQQKAGIGEDLATFRQTLNMIKSPSLGLISILNKMRDDERLRRYLFFSFRDLLKRGVDKKVADLYLQYIYGVKPLMQDIYGVVDFLKKQRVKPLLIVGKGSSQQSAQCAPKVFASGTTTVRMTENAVVRCKLWSRIDPNHAGLRALNQLGLLNPVSLTWELVPWSFVVDWFVPIGPVLQALTAPAGLIFVDGSLASKVTATGSYTHNSNSYPSTNVSMEVEATGSYTYDGYSRLHLTNWPLPGFYFNEDPFSGDRSLKALALLIANLRK